MEGCILGFNAREMIHHIAWHRRETPDIFQHAYPCSQCGIMASVAKDAFGCQVWGDVGRSNKKVSKAYWICQIIKRGEEQSNSVKTWEKVNQTSPSEDFPVVCPHNGCKAVHWKPNMKQHFQDMHPTAAIPADFAQLKELSDFFLNSKYCGEARSLIAAAPIVGNSNDGSSEGEN